MLFKDCLLILRTAFETSETIATSTRLFLLTSAGSISIWITLAVGAKVSNYPVTLSSNLAPIAIKRSHSVTAKFA